jgi:hypothetical protein
VETVSIIVVTGLATSPQREADAEQQSKAQDLQHVVARQCVKRRRRNNVQNKSAYAADPGRLLLVERTGCRAEKRSGSIAPMAAATMCGVSSRCQGRAKQAGGRTRTPKRSTNFGPLPRGPAAEECRGSRRRHRTCPRRPAWLSMALRTGRLQRYSFKPRERRPDPARSSARVRPHDFCSGGVPDRNARS